MQTDAKYSKYKRTWHKKFEQMEHQRIQKIGMAKEIIDKIARHVYKNYDVSNMYLFGSLCNEDNFSLDSDVDIAVEGLEKDKYSKAVSEVSRIGFPFKIDFVRIEEYWEFFANMIRKEGKVIEKEI